MLNFFSVMVAGRVGFTASEGFFELFLKSCKEYNIELINAVKNGDCLSAEVRYSDRNKLFDAASKSGMNIKIDFRKGLPFFFFRYRRRFGIPLGMLIFAVILSFLSTSVWSVDISETEKISEEKIIELLKDTGIEKGAFVDDIQCDDAEYYLHNKLEELGWTSISIVGSRVFVSLLERDMVVEQKKSICSDIVAAKDGEIVRADIFIGNGKLLPGTPVVKGDILVSGVTTDENGIEIYADSDADIWARTRNTVNSSAALCIDAYTVNMCKDKYLVYLFGNLIPIGFGVKIDNFTETRSFLKNSDIVFPLGYIRRNSIQLEKNQIQISEEQARLIAFYDFSRISEEYYQNTQVLEREISVTCEAQVTFTGKYLCIENIALKKEVTVGDNQIN